MIRINLLPKEFQEKGKGLDWIILGYGVVVLFALIGMGAYLGRVHGYKKDMEKRDRWSAQLQDIKQKAARVEQLDAQKTVLNAKKNTVVQLFQSRILYPKFMDAFYRTLPKDIWITDLTLSEDANRQLKVTALASALSTNAIADWLQTMENDSKRFSGATLSTIVSNTNAENKLTTFGFTLTFTYVPPPPET